MRISIFVQVGTPICIPQKEFIDIGQIAKIKNNKQPVDHAKKGSVVSIEVPKSRTAIVELIFS